MPELYVAIKILIRKPSKRTAAKAEKHADTALANRVQPILINNTSDFCRSFSLTALGNVYTSSQTNDDSTLTDFAEFPQLSNINYWIGTGLDCQWAWVAETKKAEPEASGTQWHK